MKMALNLSMYQTQLKFFTSTWIAPKWMKDSGEYAGGYLKKEHYQTFANYFLKFLEEYKKEGLDFWAITTGNEPLLAKTKLIKIPSVNWDAQKAVSLFKKKCGFKFYEFVLERVDQGLFRTYLEIF